MATGSAPTQMMSFTFIAMQSIPTVSKRPSSSATSSLVPTPSVESAIPVRLSSRITAA